MNTIRSIVKEDVNLEINEKRRNPEKNRKTTIDDFIKKVGKSSNHIFIRYSNTKEDTAVMPLNPKYDYNNVWGKYMYPYDYWHSKSVLVRSGQYLGKSNELPFAGDMEYVNFYEIRIDDGIIDNQFPPSQKWSMDKLMEMISIHPEKRFSRQLREAIENKNTAKMVELYDADDKNIITPKSWDDTVLLLWCFPYNLGFNPKEIRKVFLKVGINGFVDSKGWGYIHKNEPYQAVLLDKKVISNKVTFPNEEVNKITRGELRPSPLLTKYINIEDGLFTRKTKRILANINRIKNVHGSIVSKFLVKLVNKSFAVKPTFEGDLNMILDNIDRGDYKNLLLWESPASAFKERLDDGSIVDLYSEMTTDKISRGQLQMDFIHKYAKYSKDIDFDVESFIMVYGWYFRYVKIKDRVKNSSETIKPWALEYIYEFMNKIEQKIVRYSGK